MTGAQTTPAAPALPASPLHEPAFTALLPHSASLRADLAQIQADGLAVEWGRAGGGTFYDRANARIVLDERSQGDGSAIARSISHEMGHHRFTETPDYSSRQAYVEHQLRNEGAATLANATVRQEIIDSGGPDIRVSGAGQANYIRIASDHLAGNITRDRAIGQIGAVFGSERPSVAAHGTYVDYYGNHYDTALVPWLRATKQLPEPAEPSLAPAVAAADRPMYEHLRGQLPSATGHEQLLDLSVRARELGLAPDNSQVLQQGERVWVASTQTPGIRVMADLQAPAPSTEQSLQRSQAIEHTATQDLPEPRRAMMP